MPSPGKIRKTRYDREKLKMGKLKDFLKIFPSGAASCCTNYFSLTSSLPAKTWSGSAPGSRLWAAPRGCPAYAPLPQLLYRIGTRSAENGLGGTVPQQLEDHDFSFTQIDHSKHMCGFQTHRHHLFKAASLRETELVLSKTKPTGKQML